MGKTITLRGEACRAFMNAARGGADADAYEMCATLVLLELREGRAGAMRRATEAIRLLVKGEVERALEEERRGPGSHPAHPT